jgi:hypothetical protein
MPKEIKMTKRQLEFILELKKKLALDMAKRTREHKQNEFKKAIAKDKVETLGDVYGLFCGLSKRAMEVAAISRIESLARMGYNPAKIMELMEPKKEKGNEKTKSV